MKETELLNALERIVNWERKCIAKEMKIRAMVNIAKEAIKKHKRHEKANQVHSLQDSQHPSGVQEGDQS